MGSNIFLVGGAVVFLAVFLRYFCLVFLCTVCFFLRYETKNNQTDDVWLWSIGHLWYTLWWAHHARALNKHIIFVSANLINPFFIPAAGLFSSPFGRIGIILLWSSEILTACSYIYCCHIVWKLALIIAIASHCDWVQHWQVLLWRLLLLLHHLHHHRLRRHRPGYFSVFWEILHGVETNPVPRSDITTRMYLSSLLFSVFSHQWWVISGCTNWPKKLEHSLFSYLAQIVGQNERWLPVWYVHWIVISSQI